MIGNGSAQGPTHQPPEIVNSKYQGQNLEAEIPGNNHWTRQKQRESLTKIQKTNHKWYIHNTYTPWTWRRSKNEQQVEEETRPKQRKWFLHALRKITAQAVGCQTEKMVRALPLRTMQPAGPIALERTPGVHIDLFLDPTGLYLFQFLVLLLQP